jgi:hypothetical protein
LTVEARDADAARAARIANAHAATLLALAGARASGAIPSGRLQVIDPAVPSRSAVGPDATTLTILAGLVGFGVALALVALAESSRTTIRDGSELEAVAGVPCLASVGRAALRRRRTPVVQHAPHSRAADEYRLLAAKLDALGARSLAVVSVDGAKGSIVADNLVGALRARGARVAVVDPDDGAGDGEQRLSDRGSGGARAVLARLLADRTLFVLHPVGGAGSPTGLAWAGVAEATVLAVQRQRTPRRDVTSAVQNLRLVQARLAGAVPDRANRAGADVREASASSSRARSPRRSSRARTAGAGFPRSRGRSSSTASSWGTSPVSASPAGGRCERSSGAHAPSPS